ncbi:unnamed protein product, partial [marine sediment metagenome]
KLEDSDLIQIFLNQVDIFSIILEKRDRSFTFLGELNSF